MSIAAMPERGAPGASIPAPRGETDSPRIERGAGDAARPEPTGDPWALLSRYRAMAVAADAACASAGAIVAFAARFGGNAHPRYVLYSALVPVAWLSVLAFQRAYEFRFLGTGTEEYRRILDAGLMLFLTIAVGSFVMRGDIARGFVITVVPATVALTLMARKRLRRWLFGLRARGIGVQRVLVVGRADAAMALAAKLDHEPEHGLRVVAACVGAEGVRVSDIGGIPVVGDPAHVLEAVDATGAHVVAVASPPDASGHALRRLSWELEERGVELVVSPGIVEVAGPRLSIRPVAGLSLLHLEAPTISAAWNLAKGAFDRLVAGVLVLVLWPLLAAIALAVRASSPGPVLFRQTRVGAGGERFTMLKFRSMVADAEQRLDEIAPHDEGNGVLFKVRQDPRVTRVGAWIRRYSLDELPQLFNVLRGEMSLVGPRPPLPREVEQYCDDATRRLRVRPGLTGLWQVSGRSDLTWEESLRLDLRYVDNWSLTLDLAILWRTWKAVLRGAGAY
jgi:exopolysaccharide biosynthesis polyprenyl glycosylphosphotransferase